MNPTKDVKRLINKIRELDDPFNKDVRRMAKKLGFMIERSSGIAFIGKSQVLKYSYIKSKLPSKYKVPTKILKWSKTSKYKLMLQPKAKTNIGNKPLPKWFKKREYNSSHDMRLRNVGVYKGEIKAFDW